MGKVNVEEEQPLPANEVSLEQNVDAKCCGCGFLNGLYRFIHVKCVLVIVLSIGLLLSAVFWLPPFLQFADRGDLDPDDPFKGHEIVARFYVKKHITLLEDNILTLEDDIFDEISIASTKVLILSLKLVASSNITEVVFGVDSDAKYSKLSSTALSLVRSLFEYLVENQSLQLTKPLFGDPFSFAVLKFAGGITIIPQQSAFLLQKVQLPFNFTLNFSIYQLLENFAKLSSQLKAGLRLSPYENLYIRLSNFKGSTVAPPTIVESIVVLAVGNNPSIPRLKQLAQTIKGHSGNLGLNNTVFGKVKQVSLSSILQHSLHGAESCGPSPSPSPSPLPQPRHRHHHHHRHHHNHKTDVAPAVSPEPAYNAVPPTTHRGVSAPADSTPVPSPSAPSPHVPNKAKPPGCHNGRKRSYIGSRRAPTPVSAPTISPSAVSPQHQKGQPAIAPAPARHSNGIPVSSPLPHVVFTHVQPPSNGVSGKNHHITVPSNLQAPSHSSSSLSAGLPSIQWAFFIAMTLLLHT